jgi:DNA-binding transcriptional MerR regulator
MEGEPSLEKSPEAFRTISEAADELDVPQHVLRFWETRFAQIKPMKRGGGRRYYRPADVELLKGIRHLLYGKGYTIRGVQRILREDGVAHVTAIGRGEIDAEAAAPEAPDVGRAPLAPPPTASRARGEEAPPTPPAQTGLSAEHKHDLQHALAELEAALKLLSAGT